MPFSRTNERTDVCDTYAAPASCNTDNPPTIFTPAPHVEDILPATGANADFTTLVLLIGAALVVAGLSLVVVLAIHARRTRKYSQTVCSLCEVSHWPEAVHHDLFTYYPPGYEHTVQMGGRQSGKRQPRIYATGRDTFYVVDPLTVEEHRPLYKTWDAAVERVKEIHRDR